MSKPSTGTDPSPLAPDQQLQNVAVRIEGLVAELGNHPDDAVRAKAGEMVRLLMRLYGAGLARIAAILDRERADGGVRVLLGDDLVESLLVLHDLHPDPVEVRVRDRLSRLGGLAGLRITMQSVVDGVAHVRVAASGRLSSAAASQVRKRLEAVIAAVAPELIGVDVTGLPDADASALVQLGARSSRPSSVSGPH